MVSSNLKHKVFLQNIEQISSTVNLNHPNYNSISVCGFFGEKQKKENLAYIFNLSSFASNKPHISLTNTTKNNVSETSLSSNFVEREEKQQFTNGVEKEICVVIEDVIKWLNKYKEAITSEEIER